MFINSFRGIQNYKQNIIKLNSFNIGRYSSDNCIYYFVCSFLVFWQHYRSVTKFMRNLGSTLVGMTNIKT